MKDWINYNYNEHESEEESRFAREKMIRIQEEKQVSLEEWAIYGEYFQLNKED